MKAPIHSINIDFSHSGEAKALEEAISTHMNSLSMNDEFVYFFNLREQAIEAVELLESLEG